MIVYFSFGGTTRRYAERLSVLVKDSVFELKEKKKKSAFVSVAVWVFKGLLKMQAEAEVLPNITNDRVVYICTPIYAGDIAPVVRYFIEKSDLGGKKVNLILLCSSVSGSERYKRNAINNFLKSKCKIGFTHVFAAAKNGTDDETIADQLREIVLNIDKSF